MPCGIVPPKFSATVCPMSASVCRTPRFTPPSRPGTVGEDRDVFARMIGGGIHGIGIAAVIGGDHQQVGRPQRIEKRAEQRVEFLERSRESFHVFAVAVEHVEIHEIREDQAARLARQRFA